METITVGPQPPARPVGEEWVEHHPKVFIGAPSKSYGRRRWTLTLLFDRCHQLKKSVRRKVDSIDFEGETEDEAGAKMAQWIDERGATEKK